MARKRLAVVAAVVLWAACRHEIVPPERAVAGLASATKVYTLANLHADKDATVSAANFQNVELIPVCSEVSLLAANEVKLEFKVDATGREYTYVDHGAAGEPFDRNLARYFGPTCPVAELASLTPAEKDAVRLGVVRNGMRKQAVVLALGYPPLRDTRTLELPTWRYWTTSMRSFVVVFGDDDTVEGVRY